MEPQMLIDIRESGVRGTADFPRLNKNDTLWSNDKEIERGKTVETVELTHVVMLNREDWDRFTECLLEDHDWLDGEGGTSSDYDNEGRSFGEMYKSGEIEKWRAQAYTYAMLVACSDGLDKPILVNPEGHSYARYVGRMHDVDCIWPLIMCAVGKAMAVMGVD